MRSLLILIAAAFCIHLAPVCVNAHLDDYRDAGYYSPAFEGTLQVPKPPALEVSKQPLPKNLPWIDPQIHDDVKSLSESAAEEFATRIAEICKVAITIDQVKLIVGEILNPLETPTYLDILPATCSAKITATVPYLVDDPYHRILTGFQNSMGNDAYLEAALSNHKQRLFHLSRVVGLNYDRLNRDGITALLAACRFGNYYEVKRILKTSVCFDRRDPLGRTALHLLAQYCPSGRLFRKLMEQTTWNINEQDSHGNTVLHLAYSNVLYGDHQSTTTIDETASTTESQNSNPNDSVLEYLLTKAPHLDENIRNYNGDTVLHMACRELDSGLVNALASRGTIDLALQDCQGKSALDIIIENGKVSTSSDDISRFARCLAAFINKGAHVDAAERFGPDGNTVLHLMCLIENNAALNKLLSSPLDETNPLNKFGLTPFQIAFKNDGNKIGAMTSAFIENGCADVVVQLDRGDTILHVACRGLDLGTVKSLMEYPLVLVNHKNHLDQAPLHIVYNSQFGMFTGPLTLLHLEIEPIESPAMPETEALILEVLLANPNTDPNVRNFEGDALIHTACRKNDYDTVNLLLKYKRTIVNLMGRNNQTPIQIAFDLENLSKIGEDCLKCEGSSICPKRSLVCLLLRNPEVIPVVKSEGATLLQLACEVSNLAAIRLLLNNKNTVVDAEDSDLRTPLKIAYLRDIKSKLRRNRRGLGPITTMLLESMRISPNEFMSNAGDTLLHLACRNGDVEAIQFLLKLSNCDMNARNKEGSTPLELAYNYDQRSEEGLRSAKPYIGKLTWAILEGPNPDCDVVLDDNGNTILYLLTEFHYICSSQQQVYVRSVIKKILSKRLANPNAINRYGLMPLCTVYRNEKLSFTKRPKTTLLPIFLDSEEIDPNVSLGDDHGGSLLHVACFESNVSAVEALLGHSNIDMMVPDSNGSIPFEIAVEIDQEKSKKPDQPTKVILNMLYEAGKGRLNEAGMELLTKILKKSIPLGIKKK